MDYKPEELLSKLISFNTVNSLKNEGPCVMFIKDYLESTLGERVETKIFALDENRPILYAKISSTAPSLSPLLLYGHVDVVGVENQNWSVDPFSGIIKEGMVWGRGALDMKGEMAMFISAFIDIGLSEESLPYDIILLVLPDEEADGIFGAKYIVEHHPELFADVKFALGEIGGFSIEIGGKTLFPIMVSEKQCATLKIECFGSGGHGSFVQKNSAIEKLSRAILHIQKSSFPIIITEPVKLMISSIASAVGGFRGFLLKLLLIPSIAPLILKLGGSDLDLFAPLLKHSCNITLLEGGSSINVIPSKVSCKGDLRVLPLIPLDSALSNIKKMVGNECEVSLEYGDETSPSLNMELFDQLSEAIKKKSPEGYPVPFVLSGVTDGRFFSSLGIQTYGFTPMNLPADFNFIGMIHSEDERIPIDCLYYGIDVILDFLRNRRK